MKNLFVAATLAIALATPLAAHAARTQYVGLPNAKKNLEVNGNLKVTGTVTVPDAAIARTKLATETAVSYPIDLQTKMRNDDGTVLTASASAGKFGITNGTHSAPALKLVTEAANNNTKTDYMCAVITVPPEYVAGSNLTVAVTVSRTGSGTPGTNTIDVEAYELGTDGAVGSDICATAAQNFAASATTRNFTITGTNLVAGDKLLFYFTAVLQETASSALTGNILDISVKANIKG